MSAGRFCNRILVGCLAAVVLAASGAPAHAASKEIIQLQTQVQQLLDMMQRLQSTLDSHFGVMQNLAQQTANQATQMSTAVTSMQKELNAEAQAESGKTDAISGQVQSLNDSVDELKARIAKLDKSIQDLQTQVQTVQSQLSQAQPGAQPGTALTGPGGTALPAPGSGQPGTMPGAMPGAAAPPQAQAPPLKETYQAGLRDFNAGRYPLASSEFQDVVHYYPLDDLAGSAQFYLGEIAYQQQHYDDAVTDYNAVLEGFPGNAKAAAAQLHKGYALLALSKRAEGIRELRELIRRHPQTPEARAARSRLNGMGVRPTAR
ncbi:MAG: tetratricopeptide repeat protein [Acidobacteriota bacterium]